jgi:hypothetical protein
MASNKRQLKVRKNLKKWSMGKDRKNEVRRVGTTRPLLPLDKPNANELALKAKKPV